MASAWLLADGNAAPGKRRVVRPARREKALTDVRRRSDVRRPALLATVGAALLVALVAAAGASPQPTPVCDYCGGFESAANESGVDATVAGSTAVVDVHPNGSATWTIRNRLADGADAFRENPDALDRTVERLEADGRGLLRDAGEPAARIDGDTVVVTVRQSDVAARHAGLLVVDLLHDRGYERWYVLNVDAFTVRGPPGTAVTNDPAAGSVDGRAVTWRGDAAGSPYDAPTLDGSPYVVFGPADAAGSPATTARTTAALALATLPVVLRGVRRLLLAQTVLFAAGAVAVGSLVGRVRVPITRDRFAVGVAAVGAVAAVATLLRDGFGFTPNALFGLVPAIAYVLAGTAAWRTPERLRSPRRLAALAVAIAAVAAVVSLPFAGRGDPLALAVRTGVGTLPLVGFLPLGAAVAASDGVRRWWLPVVAAFPLAVGTLVDLADPPSGLAGGIAVFALLAAAIVVPLLGLPLALLGARLATLRSP